MGWLMDGTKPSKTGGFWGCGAGGVGWSKQHLSWCGDVTEDKHLRAATVVQKSLVPEALSLHTRIRSLELAGPADGIDQRVQEIRPAVGGWPGGGGSQPALPTRAFRSSPAPQIPGTGLSELQTCETRPGAAAFGICRGKDPPGISWAGLASPRPLRRGGSSTNTDTTMSCALINLRFLPRHSDNLFWLNSV